MDEFIKRREVFRGEMEKLRQSGLISQKDYEKIRVAFVTYYSKVHPSSQPGTSPQNMDNQSPQAQPRPVVPGPQPVVRKKVLTPDETRERKITWILILGVIMVLLSGLILATSNWEAMNAITKTILIGLIGVLFFGVSNIAERGLKIHKTAYAFWMLGSLFLPVAILSAGFFELLGSWLSVTGEGRFILGILGASICLPIYILSTQKYKSRLFAWLSLITLSVDVCYLIAAFKPTVDWFFFGVVAYNSLLILGYMRLKGRALLYLFKRELPVFIQTNLIISTLFMLSIFESHSFYGFNLILTAVLYCLMLFSQGKKEYSYVFSGILVYGIYQVVENSPFASIDVLLFALVGFVFIGFEYVQRSEDKLKKIFQYISGFVSFCAFIFISVQGILGRAEMASLIMLSSYLLISLNYLYLAYKTKMHVFSYLAPIFLLSAGYQIYKLINRSGDIYPYSIHMFGMGLVMFGFLYFKNKWVPLQSVRRSSGTISVLTMLFAIMYAVAEKEWITSCIMLALYGAVLYIVYRCSTNKVIKEISRWAMPLAWFLGILMLFGRIEPNLTYGDGGYTFPTHFGLAAIMIFLLSILWERLENRFHQSFLWISHGLIILAIPLILLVYALEGFQIPYIYLAFLGVYVYSLVKANREWMKRLFLYGSFVMFSLILYTGFRSLKVDGFWDNYIMLISSGCFSLLWFFGNEDWKKRVIWYLIPFSLLGTAMFIEMPNYDWLDLSLLVVYVGLILYVNHKSRLQILNILPIGILILNIEELTYSVFAYNNMMGMVIWIVAALAFRGAGQLIHNRFYDFQDRGRGIYFVYLDWYCLASLNCLLYAINRVPTESNLLITVLPQILVFFWFASQVNRVDRGMPRKIAATLAALSFLVPYYRFMDWIDIPELLSTEIVCLPWLALVIGLSKRVWSDNDKSMRVIELTVLLVISAILFRDILTTTNINEGLIMGGLSLLAVIVGMQLKTKSYFFVGVGDLLLNVLLLTRDFWQSVPWWVYLLGAGLILIITASITEMQKNRKDKKPLKVSKDYIISKFENWK